MKYLTSNKNTVMICVLLVIFCTFFLLYMQKKYFIKEENVILKNDTKIHIINSNAITMMYETVSGSGEYQTTTDTSWPQEGYIFNERLSGCENGETLSWNSETNRVIMESNTSDRCYVYFDKQSFSLDGSSEFVSYTIDESGNIVVHASGRVQSGGSILDTIKFKAYENINNLELKVKWYPNYALYMGRYMPSYDLTNAKYLSATGNTYWNDDMLVIINGSMFAGDYFYFKIQKNSFKADVDQPVDIIISIN